MRIPVIRVQVKNMKSSKDGLKWENIKPLSFEANGGHVEQVKVNFYDGRRRVAWCLCTVGKDLTLTVPHRSLWEEYREGDPM